MAPKKDNDPSPEDALAFIKSELEAEFKKPLHYGDDEAYRPRVLALGLPQLDEALNGGFFFNRFTILVGEESAGKTLLAMQAIKAAQAQGLPCVFLDIERSFTSEWAITLGVDPHKVLVIDPSSGEKLFDYARKVVAHGPAGVLVIDSIAAMPPAKEIADSSEQQSMGLQARMVNAGFRTLNEANDGGWMIIVVNQIREKLGIVYGNPETAPGGRGQKFYAWQWVRVRKGAVIEEEINGKKVEVGRELKIKLEKNKGGPPHSEAVIPFYYSGKFDTISGIIDQAIKLGIIIQGGGGYFTMGDERWRGRRTLREVFEDEDKLSDLLFKIENIDPSEIPAPKPEMTEEELDAILQEFIEEEE